MSSIWSAFRVSSNNPWNAPLWLKRRGWNCITNGTFSNIHTVTMSEFHSGRVPRIRCSVACMFLLEQQMFQKPQRLKRYIKPDLLLFPSSIQYVLIAHTPSTSCPSANHATLTFFVFYCVCYHPCPSICHSIIAGQAGIRPVEPSFPRKIRSASRFGSNTNPC